MTTDAARLAVLLAFGALACTPYVRRSAAAEPLPNLTYALSFAYDSAGAPCFDIALTLRGVDDATVQVRRPARWAGQDSLFKSITNVNVIGMGAIVLETDSTYRLSSATPVSFRLRQDWTGALRYPLYHRAIVDSDFAVFNAQTGLLVPDLPDSTRVSVHVSWRNLPAGWNVVTSYGGGFEQRATTTVDQLRNSSFAAGRFRGAPSNEQHAGLDVRIGGQFHFSDSTFIRTVANIWSTERAFWGDTGERFYSVVLLPLFSRGLVGGTAFTNGFVSFADTAFAVPTIALNLSHEIFHEWNGHAIATAPPEEQYKWFSEGFTEYYADRMAHAAGLLTDSGYVDRVNAALRAYYLSPVRGSSLAVIERRYWEDGNVNRYPYWQGYALALRLGQRAVDDLMHALYRASRHGGPVTDSGIVAAAAPPSRPALAAAIDSFIVRGEMVPMVAGAVTGCARVELQSLYTFDFGFDASASAHDHVVRGVRAGGPAATAGVADGMALKSWSWRGGDARFPVRLRLDDGSGREISYFPRTGPPQPTPQFVDCGP